MAPVTSRVEYSPDKRTRIYMKYKMGISQRRIAFEERVSPGDESTIARGDGEKQEWVLCPKGQRLDIQYVQPKGKPSRHSQMFWGAISFSSRSSLWPLHGDPTSARGGSGSIFVQDNAPTHKARIVQNWLREWAEQNGVTLVDLPPYSPDLNPIENIWKLLKEEICKRFPELSLLPQNNQSLNKLCEAAVEVWEDFHQDLINKLVLSMPRRLQAVVDANGWYTKY
ncbi:uncharacterized protein SAPINGB_P003800 [Magnusiomyces paraingens]|uniref:Tc1-like transposase DDE domain-containing protein n=1 Tax=Magnusiomyces paraingens TaxID=2606893 RepID=A0A5E8BWL7_9ASCO|nr:uncharacterized protein SAPINGB_P003800 [Saprochaete ingens]VVT53887.1 unnamed protein product [Saprochaete ingens]